MGLDRGSSHLTFYLESLSQGSICSSQPALCPGTTELPASCCTKEKPILGPLYIQIELRDSPPLCITRNPSTYSHIPVGDTQNCNTTFTLQIPYTYSPYQHADFRIPPWFPKPGNLTVITSTSQYCDSRPKGPYPQNFWFHPMDYSGNCQNSSSHYIKPQVLILDPTHPILFWELDTHNTTSHV